MARQITDPAGSRWFVSLSGRTTPYGRDELSLEFRRAGPPEEHRFCRFSPRGAKAGEIALEECTDRELATLLAASQPAWTAPEPEAS